MTPPPHLLLGGLLGADFLGAGATWFGWEAAGHDGLAPAVAVLLVASPLGLFVALYAPLPVARRLGRRAGITHLGSAADRALPRLRRLVTEVDHVVTTGNQTVIEVVPIEDRFKRDLIWFAGALARGATDPVPRAIAKHAGRGGNSAVTEADAHGLKGAVDRHPVRIAINGSAAGGPPAVGTTVRVDVDLRPMGQITVADEVRKGAAHCFAKLREEGIEPVLVSASLNAPDLARIAEIADVPEFHHGTEAITVLESLDDTTGVLRSATVPGTSDFAGEAVLPGEPGEDTLIRCESPSIEALLRSIRHVRRLRQARRIAKVCAVAAIVVAAPLAAGGLVAPAPAALIAGASVVLVAFVASSATLGPTPAPAPERA